MNNICNIIWFDDNFNQSESIFSVFDDYNIFFEGFESAEKGITYLKANSRKIDAIVIDGNFFANQGDENIDTKGKALNMVLEAISELKSHKEIPYFILSGQKNFNTRSSGIFSIKDLPRVYDKINPADLEELCKNIHLEVDRNPIRQILNAHPLVFEICKPEILGDKHFENLVEIIRSLTEENPENYTLIRKVFETLFVRLSSLQIIPENFTDEKGWINGTSSFLSRKHRDYEFQEDIIHPLISESLYRTLQITQDASHNEGTLQLKVDEFSKTQNTGYIYKSTVYAFLEIIAYFTTYIENNQDIDKNKQRWNKKPIQENGVILNEGLIGHLEQDDKGNYHLGKYLFSYKAIDGNYNIGDKLEITKSIENTTTTKDKYPFFVTNFKKQ